MWFNRESEIYTAFSYIEYLAKKKAIFESAQLDDFQQETILKVISATKKDAQKPDDDMISCTSRLSKQTYFNDILKAYTYTVFEHVFYDMNRNIAFRKKTGKECQGEELEDQKTIQLTHLTTASKDDVSYNIYDVLANEQMSPEETVIFEDISHKFIGILTAMLEQISDANKRQLFSAFFSMGFRTTALSQKQLGEQYGFQGNVAITLISRFVSSLREQIELQALPLQLLNHNDNGLDIYFLSHENKKVTDNVY